MIFLEKKDQSKKLSTLKDFEKKASDGVEYLDLVFAHSLRDVAREWVNLFEKDLAKHQKNHHDVDDANFPIKPDDCECWVDCDDSFYSGCHAYGEINSKIDWIRHFFNLDEGV